MVAYHDLRGGEATLGNGFVNFKSFLRLCLCSNWRQLVHLGHDTRTMLYMPPPLEAGLVGV